MTTAYEKLGIEIVIDKVNVNTSAIEKGINKAITDAMGKAKPVEFFADLKDPLNKITASLAAVGASIEKALKGKLDQPKSDLTDLVALARAMKDAFDKISTGKLPKALEAAGKAGEGLAKVAYQVKNVRQELEKGATFNVKTTVSNQLDLNRLKQQVINELSSTFGSLSIPLKAGKDGILTKSAIAQDINKARPAELEKLAAAVAKASTELDQLGVRYEKLKEKAGQIAADTKYGKQGERLTKELKEAQEAYEKLNASIKSKQISTLDFAEKLKGISTIEQFRKELELLYREIAKLTKTPMADIGAKLTGSLQQARIAMYQKMGGANELIHRGRGPLTDAQVVAAIKVGEEQARVRNEIQRLERESMRRLQEAQAQSDWKGYTPVNAGWVRSTVDTSISYKPNATGQFSPALRDMQQQAIDFDQKRSQAAQNAILENEKFSNSIKKLISDYVALNNEVGIFNQKHPSNAYQTDRLALPGAGDIQSKLDLERMRQQLRDEQANFNSTKQVAKYDADKALFDNKRTGLVGNLNTLEQEIARWNQDPRNKLKINLDTTKIDLSKVIDSTSLVRAESDLKALNHQFAQLKKEANQQKAVDNYLTRLTEDANRFIAAANAVNHHFKNVVLKRYTNTDQGVNDEIRKWHSTLQSQISAAGSNPTKAQLGEMEASLRRLRQAIHDFQDTGTRRSTKLDNPFKEMLKDLSPLKASIKDVYSALGLTNDQIRAMKPDQLQQLRTALRQFKLEIEQTTGALVRTASIGGKPSLVTDIDRARLMAYREQIDRTINSLHQLSVNSGGAGVSLQQVRDAFRQAGIQGAQLDKINFDHANRGLRQFKTTLSSVNGEMYELKKASNFFSFLGESLGKMATRLAEFYILRSIFFAIGREVRNAVSTAIEFNQSIHDIIAIAGETRDGMDEIGESIFAIAKASRFTVQEVAGLMQVLAQAGVKADQLATVSKSVGMFATATASDPKMAADLFTTAMNVFNISAERSTVITNALTAALNNSKLEASGLATAFNYLGPQAAQFGYSLEQTLGMIATTAQSGIKPSTIGTGLSQMLKEFSAPKPRLMNLLNYYGLTPDQINPMKHDFADIVDTLSKAKGKAGEVGVSVNQMFQALETRVGRAAVASINLTGQAFRDMELSIKNTDAATIAYSKSMEGAKARMNVLRQTFNEFITGSLGNIAPIFIVASQSLRGFLTLFNTAEGKITAGIISITAALGALLAVAKGIKAAVTTSLAIEGGGFLARLLGGATGVAGLVASTPVAAVVAGLVAVVGAITAYGYWLDRNNRIEEEAAKKKAEHAEATRKMFDVLNSVKGSMESASEGQKKYSDLLARHGKEVDDYYAAVKRGEKTNKELSAGAKELIKLGNEEVKLSTTQRVEIEKLIAQNPGKFDGILTEIKLRKDLNAELERYNLLMFKKSVDAGNKFNAVSEDVTKEYLSQIKRIDAAIKELGPRPPDAKKDSSVENRLETWGDQRRWDIKSRDLKKERESIQESYKNIFNKPEMQQWAQEATAHPYEAMVPDPDDPKKLVPLVSGVVGSKKNLGEGISQQLLTTEAWFDRSREAAAPLPGRTGGNANADKMDIAKLSLENDKKTLENIKKDAVENEHTLKEIQDLHKKANDLAGVIYQKQLIYAQAENRKQFLTADRKLKKGATREDMETELKKMNEQAVIDAVAVKQDVKKTWEGIYKARNEVIRDTSKAADDSLARLLEEAAQAQGNSLDRVLANKNSTWEMRTAAYNEDLVAIVKKNEAQLGKDLSDIYEGFDKKVQDRKLKPGDEQYNKLMSDTANMASNAVDISKVKIGREQLAVLDKLLDAPYLTDTNLAEKNADREFRFAQQTFSLKKDKAWLGRDVNQSEAEVQQASINNTLQKINAYKALNAEIELRKKEEIELLDKKVTAGEIEKDGIEYTSELTKITQQKAQAQQENNEKLVEAVKLLEQQKIQLKETLDDSFRGNFLKGVRPVVAEATNFNKITQGFGGNIANAAIGGTTDVLSDTINKVINPDTQAINDLKLSIANLKREKAELESDVRVMEMNSSATPQELADLSEKRVRIANINNELGKQTKQLKTASSVWESFAEGMKSVMKTILAEIAKYIAQLIAVVAVQLLVRATGFFTPAAPAAAAPSTLPSSLPPGVFVTKTGGFITDKGPVTSLAYGEGGIVPLGFTKPNVDSYPSMLMPGEVVIKKSSVDYYGADKLLALNDRKIKRFAEGGMYGTPQKGKKESNEYSLTIINVADTDSIPQLSGEEIVNIVSFNTANRGTMYKTIKGVLQS